MKLARNEVGATPIGVWISATVAIIFGALTLWSGGRALFGGPLLQLAVGNAVPFVLWFNFLSGSAYVVVGIGIGLRKDWAGPVALGLAIAIVTTFALLGWYILSGGRYETRTIAAMALRSAIWIGIAYYLRHLITAQEAPA
jgi:hypothetical protein